MSQPGAAIPSHATAREGRGARSGIHPMTVAIVHGRVPADAPEDERDVLVQAQEISESLRSLGHHPFCLPLSLDFGSAVAEFFEGFDGAPHCRGGKTP